MKASAHYPGLPVPAPVPGAWAFAVLLVLALGACSSAPKRAAAPSTSGGPAIAITDVPPADAFRANNVLIRALGLVGTPYRWGGNTPEGGFDCSGLVGYVFRDAANVSLPRTTGEIARFDASTPRRDRLASGDLVLFGKGKSVFHVGIYVGEGRFVHAPSTGGTVRLDRVDGPYWRDHYAGARRVLD